MEDADLESSQNEKLFKVFNWRDIVSFLQGEFTKKTTVGDWCFILPKGYGNFTLNGKYKFPAFEKMIFSLGK